MTVDADDRKPLETAVSFDRDLDRHGRLIQEDAIQEQVPGHRRSLTARPARDDPVSGARGEYAVVVSGPVVRQFCASHVGKTWTSADDHGHSECAAYPLG